MRPTADPPEHTRRLVVVLSQALPDSIILPRQPGFGEAANGHWAQQECEAVPACVLRPRNVGELCEAVTILRRAYQDQVRTSGQTSAQQGGDRGLFAVRSGGHSTVAGAASLKDGVLVDLCLFNQVTPSEDTSSVTIGAGARWIHVSSILDGMGIAVPGGRDSTVGVGGFTLGGGLSFFSPRYGLTCSNVISYEVVLASGAATTASAANNPDLWRALKGGSNNFGIVTSLTVRSFPSSKIWSGMLYMAPTQASKVLDAFHDFVGRADPARADAEYDSFAAGPVACFTYLKQLGIQAIAVNLVHTKSAEKRARWPLCWRTSGFRSLWRIWSSCKVRTLTSATDELKSLAAPGRRQAFATTTVRNVLATLAAAHAAYRDAIGAIRHANIKGMSWTLFYQPFLPVWARKGDPNPLGLDDGADEPLVIVSFTANWTRGDHDGLVEDIIRKAIDQIDTFAAANQTAHRYRYLNYCGAWQKPFEGYGEDNLRFMREVSRKYDPQGLFQRACTGGFKLGMMDQGVHAH